MSPLPVISSGSLPEETMAAAPDLSGNAGVSDTRSAAVRPDAGTAARETDPAGKNRIPASGTLPEQDHSGKDSGEAEASPVLRDDELWEFFCRHTLPWSRREPVLCTADTS